MTQRDWTSSGKQEGRFGAQPRIVPEPVASPGIRNALLGAFSCHQDSTAEFDRLLAKIH